MRSIPGNGLDLALILAAWVLVFLATWRFSRVATNMVFQNKTSAEIVALGLAALAAAFLSSALEIALLAILFSAFGTLFSRIELVFQRARGVVGVTTSLPRVLFRLLGRIVWFLLGDVMLAALALAALPAGFSRAILLLSACVSARELMRELRPFGEVFDEITQHDIPLSKTSGREVRLSWAATVFLGAITLLTILSPGSDVIITLCALAGYAVGIFPIALLYLIRRERGT